MNDTKTTNILLIVLIAILAVWVFQPSIDGASTAQAYRGDDDTPAAAASAGEMAIAEATSEVAASNLKIAEAIIELGEAVEKAAAKIAKANIAEPSGEAAVSDEY